MGSKWFGKTRVDASDLAEMLGDALDTAFERHLPSPQDIADTIGKSIENATFSSAEQMGKIKGAFIESQEALVQKWSDVVVALNENTIRMEKNDKELGAALKAVAETSAQHVSEIKNATSELTSQLAEVGKVATSIENILKVQEAVEGLTKQVVASEKLTTLVASFENHLAETNKFLEQASRPRTVRLIESEPDEA